MSDQESTDLDVRQYLGSLVEHKWWVVFAALLVMLSALGATVLQTKVYKASVDILLQPRSTDLIFDPNTGQQSDPTRTVNTEMQVIRGGPVRQAVLDKFGQAPRPSVSAIGQTNVVRLSVTHTDPAAAARLANAYADSYIASRRTQDVNDLLSAATQIQSRISDIQTQIDALGSLPPSAASAQLNALVQQQGAFKQQLGQLQVQAALRTGGAQIVTPATAPTSPIKPRPRRTAILALAVGLLFGGGVAFLIDYLDDSIRSKEDLERAASGHPTLGIVTRVPSWRTAAEPVVESVANPKSQTAESYRTLRTAVQFATLDHPVRSLQVTSANAGEGKTTTIANLGVALAQTGQRVIICCCDLRRPRLHEFFGLKNDIGFTSVLLGDWPLSLALQPVDEMPNLSVLASGGLPPNPAELLSSVRAAELIAAMQGVADVVLIDSPPVLPVTDAAVLSARVDATLVVASAGFTTRREFARTMEILMQVDAPIIGTVLNGVDRRVSYGYRYGYGYRYRTYKEDGLASDGRAEEPSKT